MENTLPQIIVDNLFELEHEYTDIPTVYLSECIEELGYTVCECAVDRLLVRIIAVCDNITCTITINRLERLFSVEALLNNCEMLLPLTGTWEDICAYLLSVYNGVI